LKAKGTVAALVERNEELLTENANLKAENAMVYHPPGI
jgi:hypothetical protein